MAVKLRHLFAYLIGQQNNGRFCPLHFPCYIPSSNCGDQVKSFHCPDLSEIQPIKKQNQTKQPSTKPIASVIWGPSSFRLHGVLTLVVGSRLNLLGLAHCSAELEQKSWPAGWGFQVWVPQYRRDWYNGGLEQRGCQAPGVFVVPAEGWGMIWWLSSAPQWLF